MVPHGSVHGVKYPTAAKVMRLASTEKSKRLDEIAMPTRKAIPMVADRRLGSIQRQSPTIVSDATTNLLYHIAIQFSSSRLLFALR